MEEQCMVSEIPSKTLGPLPVGYLAEKLSPASCADKIAFASA